MDGFAQDTGCSLAHGTLYLVLGCATTTIVNEATIAWVETHYDELEALVRTGLETTELMETLFYMFARLDFSVRMGYVFGYLAVRRYLQDQGLQQAVQELNAMGIECEPIRRDEFTQRRMTFFFDPDGLPLELHE